MRRSVTPERLDSDAGTPAEVAASLADLRWINKYFGGTRTMRRLVERVARATGARSLSMLDVASGSGDVPLAVAAAIRGRLKLRVTISDRAETHLPEPANAVVADAMALPFSDFSFDVVSCSLFVHHLEPGEVVRFVREALRVARVAVLINDLRRSWAHLALVYAGMPLYRSRLTRHDGPASVRRAYTMDEVRAMLGNTPAARVEIARAWPFRMGVVAWKKWPAIAPPSEREQR